MHKGVNTTLDEGQTLVAHSLKADGFDASEDGTGRGTPIVPVTISFGAQMSVPQVDIDVNQTLQAKKPMTVATNMAVRRLTPLECTRLQGFPDNYFDIPGKPFADGPIYKMLGNSMAVNCMTWIGQRIDQVQRIAA
jgi:DNA (cytosine-5)-methyltransferase 1